MRKQKNDRTTNQNNKLKLIPIISLFDLTQALTCKPTSDKNMTQNEYEILNKGFYFQLVNNNENLNIYYIFNGTILYEYFYHI